MNWLHTKEKIILEAIDTISHHGVHNLSTKKLAKKLGISESAIFRHFPVKFKLLEAVLLFYAKYDDDLIKTIELEELEGRVALEKFIRLHFQYFQNYPQISGVLVSLNYLKYDEKCKKIVDEILGMRREVLMKYIEDSIRLNELNKEHSVENYTQLLLGGINQVVQEWRDKEYSFNLEDAGRALLNTYFSIKTKGGE